VTDASGATPLAGQRIVLGIAGSIGAARAPALAARLRALGAEVQPVLTPAARGLIGLAALRDAAGCDPVTELTGRGEHVRELLPGGAALLLVAPCTANTLGQIAWGLDDDPVTTFASVLLGTVPVVVAPAMHDTMWSNPAVRANVARLRGLGVDVVEPRAEEGARKLAEPEDIVAWALRALGPGTLRGKRVLVVSGPTAEPLGPDLWLSNRSTGATGHALAAEAFRRGADVTLWLGWTSLPAPPGVALRRFGTVDELAALAPEARGFHAVAVPAAIGDYAAAGPLKDGRIPLRPTPKFLDVLRAAHAGPLVAFKAESGLDDKALLARARALQERVGADLVVANRLEAVAADATEAVLVEPSRTRVLRGTKQALAGQVWDAVFPEAPSLPG
jgi:phosphopantothenoylcysteine decarboxylase/phosphopantothenate--cysteine ligase